jgi:hypothetical protein
MAGADVREIQGLLNARFRELGPPQVPDQGRRARRPGVHPRGPPLPAAREPARRHLKVTGRVNDDVRRAAQARARSRSSRHRRRRQPGRRLRGLPLLPVPRRRRRLDDRVRPHRRRRPGVAAACPAGRPLRLLHRDLDIFARGVTRAVKVPVSGDQYQAIVSFSYNVGLGALQSARRCCGSSTATTTRRRATSSSGGTRRAAAVPRPDPPPANRVRARASGSTTRARYRPARSCSRSPRRASRSSGSSASSPACSIYDARPGWYDNTEKIGSSRLLPRANEGPAPGGAFVVFGLQIGVFRPTMWLGYYLPATPHAFSHERSPWRGDETSKSRAGS